MTPPAYSSGAGGAPSYYSNQNIAGAGGTNSYDSSHDAGTDGASGSSGASSRADTYVPPKESNFIEDIFGGFFSALIYLLSGPMGCTPPRKAEPSNKGGPSVPQPTASLEPPSEPLPSASKPEETKSPPVGRLWIDPPLNTGRWEKGDDIYLKFNNGKEVSVHRFEESLSRPIRFLPLLKDPKGGYRIGTYTVMLYRRKYYRDFQLAKITFKSPTLPEITVPKGFKGEFIQPTNPDNPPTYRISNIWIPLDCPTDGSAQSKPPLKFNQSDMLSISSLGLFEINSSVLKRETECYPLAEIAELLRNNPYIHKVEIQVHINSSSYERMDHRLTQDRADVIRDWLILKGGVEGKRLVAKGYGGTRPLKPNNTLEGRKANHRITLIISEKD